ncbi:unnamed protein product [Anisakis simplex]|uniref:Secreted protein n=1 Tax=Anisakis simplex TaxID=6269 RepID=A0A0M3K8G5_ANISI|nr:unnamed protein product [Anisakis simplex]
MLARWRLVGGAVVILVWNVAELVCGTAGPVNDFLKDDEIDALPGAERLKINFRHFSGFFKVSETHFLHYW